MSNTMVINSANVEEFADNFKKNVNQLVNNYDTLLSVVTKEAHESSAPYVNEILEDMRSISYGLSQERDKVNKMCNLLVEDVKEFDRMMGK